jgi:hypothetical protein
MAKSSACTSFDTQMTNKAEVTKLVEENIIWDLRNNDEDNTIYLEYSLINGNVKTANSKDPEVGDAYTVTDNGYIIYKEGESETDRYLSFYKEVKDG